MVDINTTPVDVEANEDLDAFSKDFFGGESDSDAKDSTGDDDSPATDKTDEVKEEEDDAPSNEPDDDSEVEEEEEPKFIPKKKKTFQERINELTAKAREAERRAEELEQKLASKAETKEPEPKVEPVKDDANRPNPDATKEDGTPVYPLGEFDPAYINDLTRYSLEQNMKALDEKRRAEEEAAAIQQAQAELNKQWNDKIVAAESEYEDFRESVSTLETQFATVDGQYGEYLASTIMAMDKGADVLYYLSQNPEEAAEIVNAGPARATIALGEIHGMFKGSGNKTLKKKSVSRAPEPPPTNKGRSVVREVPDDTDDLDAFSSKFFKD